MAQKTTQDRSGSLAPSTVPAAEVSHIYVLSLRLSDQDYRGLRRFVGWVETQTRVPRQQGKVIQAALMEYIDRNSRLHWKSVLASIDGHKQSLGGPTESGRHHITPVRLTQAGYGKLRSFILDLEE